MSREPIGYYVHHHGAGHAHRFAHIAAASECSMVPISELDLTGGIRLASDVVGHGRDPSASGALHWAPVGDRRTARRSLEFGRWLTEAKPTGVVIDVSVEAALLCRLFGVPTVVVRQHGDRTDPPHELAYRSAVGLLAPFPAELEHPDTPEWLCSKTTYAGFISPGSDVHDSDERCSDADVPATEDVVILWGAGGGTLCGDEIERIVEAASPGRVWFVGHEPCDVAALGVRTLGWIDDVAALLGQRPTVIGSAGNNVVADTAVAGCPLVVVPQTRPFDEQLHHAETLDRRGLAATVDQQSDADWAAALTTARQRRAALASLARCPNGAHVAARAIADAFAT